MIICIIFDVAYYIEIHDYINKHAHQLILIILYIHHYYTIQFVNFLYQHEKQSQNALV